MTIKHSFWAPHPTNLPQSITDLQIRIRALSEDADTNDHIANLHDLLLACRAATRFEDVHLIHVHYELMVRHVLGCSLH
jgi:hypothetical protein